MKPLPPADSPEFWERVNAWKPWFAWHPVTLLTMEVAWLRWIDRRENCTGYSGRYDYANPVNSANNFSLFKRMQEFERNKK
jgi:hypothetical protein